ncbi:Hypothetical protein NocV09_03900050 [Nannochloropsis oceanica]
MTNHTTPSDEETSRLAPKAKGHVTSPPRRQEQHSSNNPTAPGEHPRVTTEFTARFDRGQETQAPEGTHQSGIFIAEGHSETGLGGGGGGDVEGDEKGEGIGGGGREDENRED